ncbi:uncharacterized protein LOC110701531 [Chenopodium quinoa]|uniref:uncharacterized protein LOC110701531 n=1 Tax=Chenopodium quinoa TaxID=63459 RepID=UPI000B784AD2|nr:uncharacterized protein LOC110701531 [Chenopodium quinoa]
MFITKASKAILYLKKIQSRAEIISLARPTTAINLRMLSQKIAAFAYMWSSSLIFVGFLAQFTSYSEDGMVWIMFGFALMTMVNFWYVYMLTVKTPFYKELHVFEVAVNVARLFGTILAFVGDFSINVTKGPVVFVWVGVVGSVVMYLGGLGLLAKETVIELLEGETTLPVKQGE